MNRTCDLSRARPLSRFHTRLCTCHISTDSLSVVYHRDKFPTRCQSRDKWSNLNHNTRSFYVLTAAGPVKLSGLTAESGPALCFRTSPDLGQTHHLSLNQGQADPLRHKTRGWETGSGPGSSHTRFTTVTTQRNMQKNASAIHSSVQEGSRLVNPNPLTLQKLPESPGPTEEICTSSSSQLFSSNPSKRVFCFRSGPIGLDTPPPKICHRFSPLCCSIAMKHQSIPISWACPEGCEIGCPCRSAPPTSEKVLSRAGDPLPSLTIQVKPDSVRHLKRPLVSGTRQ